MDVEVLDFFNKSATPIIITRMQETHNVCRMFPTKLSLSEIEQTTSS